MTVSETGWKFGLMQVNCDLPVSERLCTCCVCEKWGDRLLQFRYCGTQGAICRRCLDYMSDLAWQLLRFRRAR